VLLGGTGFICYGVIQYYTGCLSNKVIAIAHTGCCCLLIVMTAIPAIVRGLYNLKQKVLTNHLFLVIFCYTISIYLFDLLFLK